MAAAFFLVLSVLVRGDRPHQLRTVFLDDRADTDGAFFCGRRNAALCAVQRIPAAGEPRAGADRGLRSFDLLRLAADL